MKTVILPYDELCLEVAERILDIVEMKPDACLALTVGEEQEGVYEALSVLSKMRGIRLSECKIFLVNEYEGLDADDGRGCRSRLSSLLYGTGADVDTITIPTQDNIEKLDALIDEKGGLDLALLGIGFNCRVGFNEPGTAFDSLCHRQKLTDATKREMAAFFGGENAVPEYGFTMGIKTLIPAREHIIVAAGEEKADAVFQTLYARTDSYRPSAFWQIPLQVSLYADYEAAGKL